MADYGNWIRKRIIAIMMVMGTLALLIGLLPIYTVIRVIALLTAGLTFITAAFILYVYRQFSASGGNFQHKLWHFLLEHLHWDGQGTALDIGTGNGPLAIMLAKQHPQARVTGIDYWGSGWEYSQQVCRSNASIEGAAGRVSFMKASAASLPFDDGAFDAVVSHFVFHEVADADDKPEVIREALRVLHKGGAFAFQDMFYDQGLYGDVDTLIRTIKSWGIEDVQVVDLRLALNVPRLLRHPRVLGKAALIYGMK
jgi:SAM-dependent methyltransferase